jgi:hypothetical protein
MEYEEILTYISALFQITLDLFSEHIACGDKRKEKATLPAKSRPGVKELDNLSCL